MTRSPAVLAVLAVLALGAAGCQAARPADHPDSVPVLSFVGDVPMLSFDKLPAATDEWCNVDPTTIRAECDHGSECPPGKSCALRRVALPLDGKVVVLVWCECAATADEGR